MHGQRPVWLSVADGASPSRHSGVSDDRLPPVEQQTLEGDDAGLGLVATFR
jgi:hypothetical protein